MFKSIYLTMLLAVLTCLPTTTYAQRKQQKLGRGVVATYGTSNGSAGVGITWRRLAQEPEDAKYNVYVASSANGTYKLLNSTPLANTNYAATLTNVPYGSYIAVTTITDEGESVKSKPFQFKNNGLRNIYMEIRYDKSPLNKAKYTTKFVWPCDLNGDGEMDYVVDRCPVDGSRNFYVEGYLADGTFLWNVDLGVNEVPCDGQNDNMCAYDIDCDGYGELIVQTSDGTRFWDKEKGTWGKYLFGKSTGDTDGDGIIDYETQATKNPPRYMTVIDGMTGAEKASAEFAYDVAYNRTNKASLMGDEYNKHEGHVGIFYHDGIHPAIVGEWHTRSADGNTHYYRNVAFAYVNGEWKLLFSKQTGGAVFHMIRIADVDGDGCDEMLSGAYAMDQDGSTLYNTGIAHGDRQRISDIDPERPGLECFSIQQYAGDMLGQILYDAGNGDPIKKWYLPAVGDVGRGECLDIDKNHIGWEMFSTMDGYQIYDAKGNKIEGKTGYFPTEGIWWDGQLDRERVDTPDGDGKNAMVVDYENGRLIEMAKESGWTINSIYGKRANFWGDIIGDWREELVLIRIENGVCQGIVGFTTDFKTSINNIYCLQEDPHYRGDCTTRGYYQSPNPGFYLGYDMPRPQLPPCMIADDKNDVFGIASGNSNINPRPGMKNVYAMPVKGQTLTLDKLEGNANLWKSQQGTLIINGNNTSTGKTIVSEGTLVLNGEIAGTLDLRARGTLSGSGVINDILLEGALNYEGCRIMPTKTIMFNKGLSIDKKTYIEINTDEEASLKVNGNLNVSSPVIFTIVAQDIKEGEYPLVEYSGDFSGNDSYFSVRGLTGLSYNIKNENKKVSLVINGQRDASYNVIWTGMTNKNLDYQALNFSLENEPTAFVAGDGIVFNDEGTNTTISIDDLMPISSATFKNNTKTYTIQGNGGFSGEGHLYIDGNGKVLLNNVNSNYTGKTIINGGTVTVKELADAGIASSIGAASTDASNLQIGNATLIINNSNTATNRGLTVNGTANIQIPSGTTSLKGQIKGDGTLVKTGSGQLNITYAGSNSWAATELKAGTLAMGAWNTTFGKATSPIKVSGNSTITIFNANSTSTVPTIQNEITIEKGKTLTLHAGQRCNIKGTLLGEGVFKIDFPYVRGDVYTNVSGFEGTYEVTTSNCRFVQAMDFSKSTLKMDDGAYAAGYKAGSGTETSYTNKVGSINGNGTLGTGTWNIGYLNSDDTFNGVFNSAATVNKYGNGTLTLTGSSAAPINIYEGTIFANNTNSSITSSTVTVRAGALLAGTGQAQNVTVQKDGQIGAGKTKSTTAVGTLTLNGNLTVNSGGKIRIRYRSTSTKTTCDALNVAGNVKLTSPVIEVEALNATDIVDDSELAIFTGAGSISITGDVTIMPGKPKDGWLWDTSRLASEGIIGIVPDPVGINSINVEEIEGYEVYDLRGHRITTITTSGAYIVNGKKMFIRR